MYQKIKFYFIFALNNILSIRQTLFFKKQIFEILHNKILNFWNFSHSKTLVIKFYIKPLCSFKRKVTFLTFLSRICLADVCTLRLTPKKNIFN